MNGNLLSTIIQINLLLIQANAILGQWDKCQEVVDAMDMSTKTRILEESVGMMQRLRSSIEN